MSESKQPVGDERKEPPPVRRDESGRFLPGTRPGPGRPPGAILDFRSLARDRAAREDVDLADAAWRVLGAMIARAERGCPRAAALVLDRLLGSTTKNLHLHADMDRPMSDTEVFHKITYIRDRIRKRQEQEQGEQREEEPKALPAPPPEEPESVESESEPAASEPEDGDESSPSPLLHGIPPAWLHGSIVRHHEAPTPADTAVAGVLLLRGGEMIVVRRRGQACSAPERSLQSSARIPGRVVVVGGAIDKGTETLLSALERRGARVLRVNIEKETDRLREVLRDALRPERPDRARVGHGMDVDGWTATALALSEDAPVGASRGVSDIRAPATNVRREHNPFA